MKIQSFVLATALLAAQIVSSVAGTPTLLGAGSAGIPYLLFDQFSRYANATVMNGQVPVVGPAWLTTGSALPTISSGLLVNSGTGYLYTNLTTTPQTLGAKISFTGGTNFAQLPFAMAFSSQTPPSLHIENLVHQDIGPDGFTFGVFDGSGNFTALLSGSWVTPMNNTGTIYETYFGVIGSTVIVVGPNGEQFSVTDPTIATNYGPMVFFEPNLEGDGLQAQVSVAYAINNKVVSPGTTTLNPADLASITLSGGNLTAASTSSSGAPQVRSIAGRTNGTVHFEFTIDVNASPSAQTIIIGPASLSQHTLTTNIGGDFKSAGFILGSSTQGFLGNATTNIATNMTPNVGDVFAIEINFATSQMWIQDITKASGWNGASLSTQNPATNTGGFSFSSLGGAPYGIGIEIAASGNSVTLNTGGSAYAMTPSSGYGNWL